MPESIHQNQSETTTAQLTEPTPNKPLLSFFIPDLTIGGAEQVTVNIVNGLAKRGYNIELLLSKQKGELQSQLEDEVTLVELPPSQTSTFGVATHLPALLRYLREREPAALFPHLAHVSIVCLSLKRVFDIDTAIVPTHHRSFGTSERSTTKDRIVHHLIPRLYPSADRIITVSGGVADSIVSRTPVNRKSTSVLYNPIDIKEVQRQSQEQITHNWIKDDNIAVVLFVGRIHPQKDLKTWLRAFKKAHQENPDIRGILIGKGPQQEAIQSFAEKIGIEQFVSMLGYVDNPYGYMRQADLFLLSSEYEGLPTVLIEALACGCPVVATDCPSGPEKILLGGEYGELVSVNDVSGLAEAVIATLNDPIDSDKLQERADDFDMEAVLDDYERFIEEYILTR